MKKKFLIIIFYFSSLASSKDIPIGIKNITNTTCYMASAIQCLYNIKPLKDFLISTKDTDYYVKDSPAEQFVELIYEMSKISSGLIDPKNFCTKLPALGFAAGQQDSGEFVINLLNNLSETGINEKAYKGPWIELPHRRPQSEVFNLFAWFGKDIITCTVCSIPSEPIIINHLHIGLTFSPEFTMLNNLLENLDTASALLEEQRISSELIQKLDKDSKNKTNTVLKMINNYPNKLEQKKEKLWEIIENQIANMGGDLEISLKILQGGVQILLNKYFEQREVPYACSECKKKPFILPISETLGIGLQRITSTSQFLIIQLNRFSAAKEKLNLPVKIQFTINLKNCFEIEPKEDVLYDLISVIQHSGAVGGGHYTALINRDSNWYECNDTTITPAKNINDLQTKGFVQEEFTPYILFYGRRDLKIKKDESKIQKETIPSLTREFYNLSSNLNYLKELAK